MFFITWFNGCIDIEEIHPLEGGFLRRKAPQNAPFGSSARKSTRFLSENFSRNASGNRSAGFLSTRSLRLIYRKVRKDPKKLEYMDLALEPVRDDETETRELFQSEAAHNFVEKIHRNEKARHGETV